MSRKRWIWTGVGVAVAALVVFVGVKVGDTATYINIATGYAAQQTCACLNVSGRALDSCLADFPDDARKSLKLETSGQSVHASVLGGMVHAEAVYDERYGCHLVN